MKVLIIKVGYSETLDPEISDVTSYGDVLRTTVLLHLFKNDHVTWLVDEKAYPILKGNPLIHRILIYNLTSVLQLQAENFDTVINLEKVPGLCALADSIRAWRRYGFRFEDKSGEAEAYDGSHLVLDICKNIELKRNRSACWQEGLFEMVGAEWKGEEYVLGYKPKSREAYDIGFNYLVGTKWSFNVKAWPVDHFKKLESLIGEKYTVSWQQGRNNIEEYFEWINSCSVLVTNDSFGMHIAMALKKKVIALFGGTSYKENHLYGRGVALYEKDNKCPHYPCYLSDCTYVGGPCVTRVTPERAYEEVLRIMDIEVPDKKAQESVG